LKRTRGCPQCDREPDVVPVSISRSVGPGVWHVLGPQRTVREWAMRQCWEGRPVRQEQAQGILVAALGMLVAHFGYGEARRASEGYVCYFGRPLPVRRAEIGVATATAARDPFGHSDLDRLPPRTRGP
jgi:hypothetical protein